MPDNELKDAIVSSLFTPATIWPWRRLDSDCPKGWRAARHLHILCVILEMKVMEMYNAITF